MPRPVISTLYHGTTAPGLSVFEFGIKGFGEELEPVNGVWLATREEGAAWHANAVAARKNGLPGFVYTCVLDPTCVIADTRRDRLPPLVFKRLVALHMPWHRRMAYRIGGKYRRRFTPYAKWFLDVYRAGAKARTVGGSNAKTNALIAVCKSIGVDVILNPLASPYGDGIGYYDEGQYGTVALLINPTKAKIVSCRPS